MPGPRDKIEKDLFTELARLRARMQEIHEHGGCQDPDIVMAEIEAETTYINSIMEKIVGEIEASSEQHSDLNALTDDATRALVSSAPFPVVMNTFLDPQLPAVPLPADFLRALLLRALRIMADHQGPGCDLKVSSRTADGKVVLNVTATNSATELRPCLPLQIRGASLAHLIQEANGEMQLEELGGRVELTLRLAHAVPTK
ncbi:MAG: hypothetical protein ACYTGW_06020 [Planctomycetota bacterium]|jgi:hypothetical protein